MDDIENSVWISRQPGEELTKLNIDNQDIPTRSEELATPQWEPNRYVTFGPTDKYKDASQHTVPFLDATMVQGKPWPLSGVGLYYKSKPGHSGYVAPVLIAHNAVSQKLAKAQNFNFNFVASLGPI